MIQAHVKNYMYYMRNKDLYGGYGSFSWYQIPHLSQATSESTAVHMWTSVSSCLLNKSKFKTILRQTWKPIILGYRRKIEYFLSVRQIGCLIYFLWFVFRTRNYETLTFSKRWKGRQPAPLWPLTLLKRKWSMQEGASFHLKKPVVE